MGSKVFRVEKHLNLHTTLFQALNFIEFGESGHSPHSLFSLGEEFMAEQGPLEDEEAELSELEYLMLDTTDIITCLYRLSIAIQSPAPKERLRKIAAIDVSSFEHSDVEHIYEMFCPVDSQNKYLIERLGKANTKRRQLLRYYELQHNRISSHIDSSSPLSTVETNEPTNTPKPVTPAVEGGSARSPEKILDPERATIYYSTVASLTTVDTVKDELSKLVDNDIEKDDDQLSQTSYATSTNHPMKIRVPPPPSEDAAFGSGPFECPYCFNLIEIRNRKDWK